MLDDLKYIHGRDAQDALGVAEKQWQQLQQSFNVSFQPSAEIYNIVVGGMGGSAWPALYLQSWPGVNVPLEISRNYNVPGYVGKHTLFIASSYSGNTEETLASLAEAEAAGAQIAVMTSGGLLKELAAKKNLPLYLLPSGTQPRMSSLYFISALVELLETLGLVKPGSISQKNEVAEWLNAQTADWTAEIPVSQNPAKQLALELMGKTVVIYSGPLMSPATNKWKICINESAKNLAWWNQYPEFNHNEFIGWSGHPADKPFAVVEIRSNLEHERTQKRFKISEKLLSGKRPAPFVVEPKGETASEQLFWTSVFGDFVSIYLALLNGVNPTPVELVEKLKTELNN